MSEVLTSEDESGADGAMSYNIFLFNQGGGAPLDPPFYLYKPIMANFSGKEISDFWITSKIASFDSFEANIDLQGNLRFLDYFKNCQI